MRVFGLPGRGARPGLTVDFESDPLAFTPLILASLCEQNGGGWRFSALQALDLTLSQMFLDLLKLR
jgi:hypothetical protein